MTNYQREIAQRTALKAAELVESGWCQRFSRLAVDGKPCYCAKGALCSAAYETGGIHHIDHIEDVALNDVGADALQYWNDAPERTQSEVVALFRRVASQFNPPGWDSVEA